MTGGRGEVVAKPAPSPRAPGGGAYRPSLRAHSRGRRGTRGAVVAKPAQRTGAPGYRDTPPPHQPTAGAPPTKGSTQTTGENTEAKAFLSAAAACLSAVCLSVCLSTLNKRRGRYRARGLLAVAPGDGAATAPGVRALRAARADLLGTVATCHGFVVSLHVFIFCGSWILPAQRAAPGVPVNFP